MKVRVKDKEWFEKNAYKDNYGVFFDSKESALFGLTQEAQKYCGKVIDIDKNEGDYNGLYFESYMYDVIEEKSAEIQKPKRKVIQISNSLAESGFSLTALCDDGSIWSITNYSTWERMPDIPQED
jgi:hypothetical protein